ncbi:MAG: HD domain-containing protein [Desulfuromonadaceae bacterium]|nr:HD domain-containing protein [Desulfuromonadaceae bacterium]
MKMILFSISAAVGIGFAYYGSRKWVHPEVPIVESVEPTEVSSLAELSHLWIDDEVEIKDASYLWRERAAKKSSQLSRPVFRHEEIDQFFTEMIEQRPSVHGLRRSLIIKILTLLDEEGDCPSVVRVHKDEAERIYSDDSYALLETVPLYRHTLTVARNFIAKADQEALLADMIIIALAHDIGKIPSYHDSMYSSGDHPIIAGLILKSLPEYMALPNWNDINRAITGHHLLKSDNILTDGLKLSDHEARQTELSALYAEVRERRKQEAEKGVEQPTDGQVLVQKPTTAKTQLPTEEREHPLGSLESREKFYPTKQDIPEWFDADAILAAIKKRINVVESTAKGEQWSAVSTSQGLVYVNPEGLWANIKEVSNFDPKVLASEGFESEKRNLLFTVVSELSRTRDAIATQYVADRYYTTQVSIITGGGKRLPYLLIPFTAEAFGELPSTLEELKTSQLKRMVKEIKLKQTEVEKCVGR